MVRIPCLRWNTTPKGAPCSCSRTDEKHSKAVRDICHLVYQEQSSATALQGSGHCLAGKMGRCRNDQLPLCPGLQDSPPLPPGHRGAALKVMATIPGAEVWCKINAHRLCLKWVDRSKELQHFASHSFPPSISGLQTAASADKRNKTTLNTVK